MDVFNNHKKSLDLLWSKYHQDLKECLIPPLCPDIALEESILIIGLNPSLTPLEEKNLLEEYKNKNLDDWCAYSQHGGAKLHRYFRRFPQIVEGTEEIWTHIDLLFIRKGSSQTAKWLWKNKKEFIEEQLKISTEIIQKLNPKIIIVNTAFGRELIENFQSKEKYSISGFDSKVGVHYFNEIPIFFSSMIEGPSPMDKGTFERLKWHVKYVLGKLITDK